MAVQIHHKQLKLLRTFLRFYHKKPKPSVSSIPEVISSHRDNHITEIVDVRTPDEFELDNIPGSINLPVLSNEERVTVGTLYSKDKFTARKLGASLISKNISEHVHKHFYFKPEDYSPLVYCWRGGQRSYSLGLVLAQIGFQTFVLEGGYQQYRDTVRGELTVLPDKFTYKVISGLTGSGKTRILHTLQSQGEQVLDLEGLAKHKGSVLGLWHGETQPSQKLFDSLLCHELHSFNADKPIWVESESIRIGNVYIPGELFRELKQACRYNIVLPIAQRVKHIINDYPNWIDNKESLKEIINKLVKVRGHAVVNSWLELIDNEKWEEFVESILLDHYDPTYTLSQTKNNLSKLSAEQVDVQNLEDSTLLQVTERLIRSPNIMENEVNEKMQHII